MSAVGDSCHVKVHVQRCHFSAKSGSKWPTMGQIRDFSDSDQISKMGQIDPNGTKMGRFQIRF